MMEFLTATGSGGSRKQHHKAKKRHGGDDDDGDDYLVEDIVLGQPAAAEGRQWINSNFTVTPVQGAALVLAIAALIGVGFATLYVAQFSFQATGGRGQRSVRSVGAPPSSVGGDTRREEGGGEEGKEALFRRRTAQIVGLLSDMDEHIRELYSPAAVARWEEDGMRAASPSGTARCKKWAVCRVVSRERIIRKKGGAAKKKAVNRLKDTLQAGGKTMKPLRSDGYGPTELPSPFDAFEDYLEAAWIGRNSQDAKGCNMFADDCGT